MPYDVSMLSVSDSSLADLSGIGKDEFQFLEDTGRQYLVTQDKPRPAHTVDLEDAGIVDRVHHYQFEFEDLEPVSALLVLNSMYGARP